MRSMAKGDRCQIMRRGYFVCDAPYMGPDRPLVLIDVPDGKSTAVSVLSGKVAKGSTS